MPRVSAPPLLRLPLLPLLPLPPLLLALAIGCAESSTAPMGDASTPGEAGAMTGDAGLPPAMDAGSWGPVGPRVDEVFRGWSDRTGVPFAFRGVEAGPTTPERWSVAQERSEGLAAMPPWTFRYEAEGAGARAVIDSIFLAEDGDLVVRTLERDAAEGCAPPRGWEREAMRVRFTVALRERIRRVVVEHRSETTDCATLDALRDRVAQAEAHVRFFEDTRLNVLDDPVDTEALEQAVRARLLDGEPGDPDRWATVLREILLAFPIGHASLSARDRFAEGRLPTLYGSPLGVCLRPTGGDRFVVSFADEANPLGLNAGDHILAVNNECCELMFDTALRRPVSGTATASEANRRMQAALAAAASVEPGTLWLVRRVAEDEWVEVPRLEGASRVDCTDAFARPRPVASATLREDGIAVVRVARWLPEVRGADPDFEALAEETRRQVLEAFLSVRDDARAIVWDVRGNQGGATSVALEVVSGFASARPTSIATCEFRATRGRPTRFEPNPFIDYEVAPARSAFSFDGPSALLVDGLGLSANDYFVFAADVASEALVVGTGASGGYGAATIAERFAEPLAYALVSDPNRCLDALGRPLETRVVTPDRLVELEGPDLAAGRDTQLEAAVRALREELAR